MKNLYELYTMYQVEAVAIFDVLKEEDYDELCERCDKEYAEFKAWLKEMHEDVLRYEKEKEMRERRKLAWRKRK